jgi:hypothetical protein
VRTHPIRTNVRRDQAEVSPTRAERGLGDAPGPALAAPQSRFRWPRSRTPRTAARKPPHRLLRQRPGRSRPDRRPATSLV